MKYLKIGIVGLGFLGGTMDKYFSEKGLVILRYDKKGIGSQEEVSGADIVFICVNTPYDAEKKEIDLSYVESAVGALSGNKIVVIRSTVPPGTTERLQKEFPSHKFTFNPEFLRAKFAYEDFVNPPRQIVGYTEASKDVVDDVMVLLPEAPKEHTKILSASSAELIKYASNLILAVKVSLGSKIFEIAGAVGVDYDEIKNLIGADKRIGPYGLDVFYEGFRGYNGTCFPKDVRTIIFLGEKLGIDMDWLKLMDDENIDLLKKQGLDPDYGYPKSAPK